VLGTEYSQLTKMHFYYLLVYALYPKSDAIMLVVITVMYLIGIKYPSDRLFAQV